jgi:HEAT repeat protein
LRLIAAASALILAGAAISGAANAANAGARDVQQTASAELGVDTREHIRALESSDFAARERAAAALSERAASGDPKAIAALIPLLHDPNSKIRYHADWGLARAGAPAVPGLLAEFRARDDDAGRARVAGALGRIGLAAAAAIPDLRTALADPDSSAAGQAAYALGRMRAREAVPDLVRAYSAARRTSRQRQIARALRAIGSDQGVRSAKEQLVAALEGDLAARDAAARSAAVAYADALYRAVRGDKDGDFPNKASLRALIPGLVAELDDPDPERALAAARALELAGRDGAPATASLQRMLDDPRTRHQAIKTLRVIGSAEAARIVENRVALDGIEKRIRTDYSVSDHQGRTWLTPFRVAGSARDGMRLSARFLYPSREPQRPRHVVIGLESTSLQVRFETVRELTWVADGRMIRMAGLERSWSRGQNGGVIEQLSGMLPVGEFLAIATAQTLRARIGPLEFAVAEPDLIALRHFAERIPAAAPAARHP